VARCVPTRRSVGIIRTRFCHRHTRVYYAGGPQEKSRSSQRVHRCECGIKEHRDLFFRPTLAYHGWAPSSGTSTGRRGPQPPSATQPARPQDNPPTRRSVGAHQRPAQSQRRDATEPVGAELPPPTGLRRCPHEQRRQPAHAVESRATHGREDRQVASAAVSHAGRPCAAAAARHIRRRDNRGSAR